ncbi:MAG: Gldg family protein [Oligoflexales bacterium]
MQPRFFLLPVISLILFILGIGLREYAHIQTWGYSILSFLALCLLFLWSYLEFWFIRRIWEGKKTKQNLSIVLMMLIVLGLVLLSNRPRFNLSLDLSQYQDNSLSQETKSLIERLIVEKRQINIKAFFVSAKIQRNFKKLLQRYLEYGAPLSIEYIDPQLDIVSAKANKIEQAHVAIFELDDKLERVTLFNEESISNAILKLLIDETLNIYFLTGHGEPSILSDVKTGFKTLANTLIAEGYEVASLNLSGGESIPQAADLMIIAGPKVNIPIIELKKITRYIEHGGALLIMLDAMRPSDSINNLLEPYGLAYLPDFIVLSSEDPRIKTYGQNAAVIDTNSPGADLGFALFKPGIRLFFSDSRSLAQISIDKEVFFPLVTNSKALQIGEVYSEDDLVNLGPSRLKQGSHKLMALVKTVVDDSKYKSNYIAAFGSSQFIQNERFIRPENRQILLKTVNYLLRKSNFVSLSKRRDKNRGNLEINSRTPVVVLSVFCFIYPFGYLLIGAIIWYRRKKE